MPAQELRAAHRREDEPEELFDCDVRRGTGAKPGCAIDSIALEADEVRVRIELDQKVGIGVEKFAEVPADPIDGCRRPRNHQLVWVRVATGELERCITAPLLGSALPGYRRHT